MVYLDSIYMDKLSSICTHEVQSQWLVVMSTTLAGFRSVILYLKHLDSLT